MIPKTVQHPFKELLAAMLLGGGVLVAAWTVCARFGAEYGEFTGLSLFRQGLDHPGRTALGLVLVLFSLIRTPKSEYLAPPGDRYPPYKKGGSKDILYGPSCGP